MNKSAFVQSELPNKLIIGRIIRIKGGNYIETQTKIGFVLLGWFRPLKEFKVVNLERRSRQKCRAGT